MVEHNIDPYGEWSAMPDAVQQLCRDAAKQIVDKAAAAAAAAAASKVPTFAAVQLADLADWLPPGSMPSSSGGSGSSNNKNKKKGGSKKKGRK